MKKEKIFKIISINENTNVYAYNDELIEFKEISNIFFNGFDNVGDFCITFNEENELLYNLK